MLNQPELRSLASGGVALYADEVLLATTIPLPDHRPISAPPASAPYTLSCFASLRRDHDGMLLESPLAAALVRLHDWRATALLHTLDQTLVSPAVMQAFFGLLYSVGFSAHHDELFRDWTPADLMFLKGVRSEKAQRHALPPIKPPMSTTLIPLEKPHTHNDQTFLNILDQRQTIYTYTSVISKTELSVLLYHTARVKELIPGQLYNSSRRPYPSAGAAYELEIYPLVGNCVDLDAGLYHYCPLHHHLEALNTDAADRHELLNEAAAFTGMQIAQPQIVLLITARIGRINWKQRALALALENLGVLYQTLYLTATALGLAPCALGAVNMERFAAAVGVSEAEEPLVGQMMIGK
jgi:SagB-type dehydrogenase family enzyme